MLDVLRYNWSIAILIILLSLNFEISSKTNYNNNTIVDSNLQNEYETHEPIMIESENDLIIQGWSGNGTEKYPYRIEKLNITSETLCILVFDIHVYLLIKDCLLVVSYPASLGFMVRNSRYIQILDCIIDSQTRGLEICNSTECEVSNTSISGCPYGGLVVTDSLDCIFTNNSMFDCGFLVYGDSVSNWRHEFIDNTVNENQLGYFLNSKDSEINCESYGQMILVNCENVNVHDGKFQLTFIGIQVVYSDNLLISQVDVRDITYSGLSIIHSDDIAIDDSEFHDCGFAGIEVHNSRVSVNNSIIHGNMQGGILTHTSNLVITNNRIFNNRGYGGIYIFNVSGECTIRSNMVYLNQMLGISLIDVIECTIVDNYVEGHRSTGIYVEQSWKCVCINNTLVNNVEGIYLREIERGDIIRNRISGSDDFALHLFSMTEIEVNNNTIYRNWDYGFYLNQIKTAFFRYNHIYENGGIGMYFYNSTDCRIYSNNIHDNDDNGISIVISEAFSIFNNSFHSNDMHGMHLSNSHDNEIRNNKFFENSGYGLLLSDSDFNRIVNNSFYLNLEGNARDDGNMNRWDAFSGKWQGNWWDDWDGTDAYLIPGEPGNADRYPSLYNVSIIPTNMTTPITIPIHENGFLIRISIAFCIVIVGILAMTFWYRERK